MAEKQKKFIFGALFLLSTVFAGAAIIPAPLFVDNAVLQRDVPVRVWGIAAPGEVVTVLFAGQKKTAVTDAGGEWHVQLDPMEASSEPCEMVFSSSIENQKLSIENVVVGEVWLGGGQSNMAMLMSSYRKQAAQDISNADDSLLRIVKIPRMDYAGQNSDIPEWQKCSPANALNFPATAFYFAKNLRAALNVPVGVIACAVGGVSAEVWMSRDTLENNLDLKPVIDAYDSAYAKAFANNEAEYLKQVDAFQADLAEWTRRRSANETPLGPRPVDVMGPRNVYRPCGLYETMLLQTVPYTFRGVIWYQGESSTRAAFHHRYVLPALIEQWRNDFKNPALPFLIVQLPTCIAAAPWEELREAQALTVERVKNTGMIVTVDCGEAKDVHPATKDKVGYRLALLARNMVYGETNLVCNGPRFSSVEFKDGRAEVSFGDAGAGIILKPEPASAFEISGADGNYFPADAELVNEKIILSAASVKNPAFVRYGWKSWFVPVLFNREGLPAAPFRTDDFPLKTQGRFYLDNL